MGNKLSIEEVNFKGEYKIARCYKALKRGKGAEELKTEQQKDYEREVEILRKTDHPFIIKYVDLFKYNE